MKTTATRDVFFHALFLEEYSEISIKSTVLLRVLVRSIVLVFDYTANYYSKTTALLRQKGCTLDFAMTIGSILEFAVPLLLKSGTPHY